VKIVVNIPLEQARFESWYKTFRKFETDIHGNYLGNVTSMHELLLRNDKGGYLYGQPDACWAAWQFRAGLDPASIASELCTFELWFKDHMGHITHNAELWLEMMQRRNNTYDNSRAQECSRAWAARVMLEREALQKMAG
jgi:hypothetical protein